MKPKPAAAVALLLTLLACVRVADTWHRFSQTYDEPFHVVMGLEWLQRGTYRLEVQHPPLARIFDAIGLAAAGRRFPPGNVVVDSALTVQELGNRVLEQVDYQKSLMLARAGALPFLLLGILVVWVWTRRLAGPLAAAIAVFLFSTLPPILAHAGLATTDMAAAATVPAAILAFVVWLEEPSWRNTAILTIAAAAALLTKFSSIPFCGMAALMILLWRAWTQDAGRRTQDRPRTQAPHRPKQLLAALAGIAAITWALYRFSLWPEPIYNFPPPAILLALADKHDFGSRLLLHLLRLGPIPAPEFFTGLAHLSEHAASGHESFLLGRTSTHGWWYFFPVAVGVKTPLPFLLLSIPGAAWLLRRSRREREWLLAAPALAAAAVIIVAVISRIDIGIRHVLPLYAPLAVCGGMAGAAIIAAGWKPAFRGAKVLLYLLLVWQLASSLLAHPDYLAWFNELAGSRPDATLVDSNLDWGQDLPALREAIRENRIKILWIAYFGSTNLQRYPLGADIRALPRNMHVRGWIAISRSLLAGVYEGRDFAWLKNETPAAEVGKSMVLYYVR
jgi:4-amino-4-deoxy-L-arabinose transferase-like glycosyltransferase